MKDTLGIACAARSVKQGIYVVFLRNIEMGGRRCCSNLFHNSLVNDKRSLTMGHDIIDTFLRKLITHWHCRMTRKPDTNFRSQIVHACRQAYGNKRMRG